MIEIGINPEIFSAGFLTLSWHGLFMTLAIALAVFLVGRRAPRHGISSEIVYSVAIWAVIGGIVGARLVHVADDWDFYSDNPERIFQFWRSGIAVWGGILGGFVGGLAYAKLNKLPAARLADITAPAMLLAQAVGRIGDIINGEHFTESTSHSWGVVYTHPSTQNLYLRNGIDPNVPTHPGVAYELIWDLAVFAIVWWVLRKRLQPDGMLFAAYLALYAFGRFFILFFHTYDDWIGDLNEAQIISLAVLVVTVPLLGYRARLVAPQEPVPVASPTRPPSRSRPERRRGTATRRRRGR